MFRTIVYAMIWTNKFIFSSFLFLNVCVCWMCVYGELIDNLKRFEKKIPLNFDWSPLNCYRQTDNRLCLFVFLFRVAIPLFISIQYSPSSSSNTFCSTEITLNDNLDKEQYWNSVSGHKKNTKQNKIKKQYRGRDERKMDNNNKKRKIKEITFVYYTIF